MSAGTKVYTVRLPQELVTAVEKTIDRRNDNSDADPWSFSDFIRICLTRELEHMERSRKARSRKAKLKEETYQG